MAARKRTTKKKKASEQSLPGTPLPEKGDPDALYLIDISGYIFRAYHALPPLSTSRGEPTHAVRGVVSMVLKLIQQRDPSMLAVALDSRTGSFRRDIYPKYKANRPPPPEDLSQQIDRIYEVIGAFGIPMLAADGMEADDVIATACTLGVQQKMKVVVVSADKDLLQLVGDDVVMWDTMREKVFGVPETIEKFGVPPKQVRDLLALTGDTSDNVPGVPSVGPKTAAKLLTAHDTLDGVYKHIDEVKGRVKDKLIEHEDPARLSQQLVTLRDDLDITLDRDALAYDGGDAATIRRIFTELEFTRLLAQLDPIPNVESSVEVITTLEGLERGAAAIRKAGAMSIVSVLSGKDPLRADLIGFAMSWVEGVAMYVPLAHRYIGCPDQLSFDDVARVMRPLLENSLLRKRAPSLKREDLVWTRHGITWRGGSFDVSLASYLYDPSRHSHALEDVARVELGASLGNFAALTKGKKQKRALDEIEVDEVGKVAGAHSDYVLRLGKILGGRMDQGEFPPLYYDLELPLTHVLADMERLGVQIDPTLLGSMAEEAGTEMASLEKTAYELAGKEFSIGSPRQLETILFDELDLPVIKRTKTARSTDAQVLGELRELHDLPDVVLEWRTLSKLKGTYLDALPAAMHPDTGRIHTRYNQAVAATGRLSSSDPNLQNIPIRTELGRRIRDAFIPREGTTLLAADYSQIELRVLAHLSQDPELIDAYNSEDDVHVRTATALFEVPAEDVTREQRGAAKTVNFAVIYGQTQWALAMNLKIKQDEAKRYIEAFFERYAGVGRFMDEVINDARATGYVMTLLGRRRALADMRSKNPALRHAAERIARNTPIQGTAADIIKVAMVGIHRALRKRRLKTRMILTVHDELLFEVPHDEKDEASALIRSTMESAHELSVPLVVDMGWGDNWGQAH